MEFLMEVFSQRSGLSTPLSQLNLMVDSWTTKRNDNLDSSSIFDDNIGKDGRSIQSAYAIMGNSGDVIESCAVGGAPYCGRRGAKYKIHPHSFI